MKVSLLAVAAGAAAGVLAAVPNVPVFAPSYTAEEMAYHYDQNNQLEQTAHLYSCWLQTANNNITAYRPLDGGEGQVFNWTQNQVYVTDGGSPTQVPVCQFSCDISDEEQCDGEDSLCSYNMIYQALFNGTTTVSLNGTNVPADSFTWTEGLPGEVMNTLTLYTQPGGAAVPLQMYRQLTPFGQYIGYFVNNYLSFDVGAPDQSCYAMQNLQYCPIGDPDTDCNDYVSASRSIKAFGPLGMRKPFRDIVKTLMDAEKARKAAL